MTPKTNQDSLIWYWISGGLLSMIGYGYVRQLIWEWPLLIVGKCFVMGLRETTVKNWSVSENSRNNLLNIASTILFHLIEENQQRTYLSLMRSTMEIKCLPAVHFILPVLFLPLQRSALFPTWLSKIPQKYLSDLSIFPKKKKLKREGYITWLLGVNVHGSWLREIDAYRESFGFAIYVIVSTRRCTIVDKSVVIFLKRIMTPSLVSFGMFHVWLVHNNNEFLG